MNTLYYGDNFDVLRLHIAAQSVDLIYLDPPFQSGRDYNVLFEEQDGTQATAQIQAFEDTWQWDEQAVKSYDAVVSAGGPVAAALEAFRKLLGSTPMLAYVSMMAPRLLELRRVLKSTGSIYLHCDLTASAHLRLLMDAVFGSKNFRNEIVWYYYNKMHDSRKKLFPRATDTLLFYVKDVDADFTYKQLKEMRPTPVRQLARKKVDGRMVNVKDNAFVPDASQLAIQKAAPNTVEIHDFGDSPAFLHMFGGPRLFDWVYQHLNSGVSATAFTSERDRVHVYPRAVEPIH